MRWHFTPETGSQFWLDRVGRLEFDPLQDVKSMEDLALFPNLCDELRDVPVADLIPRGYENPQIVGVFESGGTTGAPKRVVLLEDWCQQSQSWSDATLDANGVPHGVNWLIVMPTGPHLVGRMMPRSAVARGGVPFTVDMDPRWVKSLLAQDRFSEAAAYAAHILDQARHVLRTQDVRVLATSPPMLERLAEDEELVELVRAKIGTIVWGGAHMDADTRHLLRSRGLPRHHPHRQPGQHHDPRAAPACVPAPTTSSASSTRRHPSPPSASSSRTRDTPWRWERGDAWS